MAMENFALKGTKIHRTSCKRLGDGAVTLDQAAPTDVASATIASCCKPNAAKVYIEQAGSSWGDDPDEGVEFDEDGTTPVDINVDGDHPELDGDFEQLPDGDFRDHAEERAVLADQEAEREAELASSATFEGEDGQEYLLESGEPVRSEPAPEGPVVSLPAVYKESGAAAYHWPNFGREGGVQVAEQLGVEVKADNPAMRLVFTGDVDAVDGAITAVTRMWVEGYKAFKAWRKIDPTYKAMPQMGAQWVKSERFLAEKAWLADYVTRYIAGEDLL